MTMTIVVKKNDDNDDGYEFDIPQALPNNTKSVY